MNRNYRLYLNANYILDEGLWRLSVDRTKIAFYYSWNILSLHVSIFYLSIYAGIENDEDPDDDGDGILDENDEL